MAPRPVVGIGKAKGIGRGTVAGNLAVDCVRHVALGVLQFFEHEHTGPLAQDKSVSIAVKRPAGRVGSSLRVESAVRRLKPVTPNGWIMLCVPPKA